MKTDPEGSPLMTKAEIGGGKLQSKECPGLLEAKRSKGFSDWFQWEHSLPDALILDFWPPDR